MATPQYGLHRFGGDQVVRLPVKASETWEAGDMLDLDASGYAQACDAGDIPLYFAIDEVTSETTPASDGEYYVTAYVGAQNIYRYPPDTGSATIAIVGKKMDVGGQRSVNIDASTDGSLLCVGVDATNNYVYVQAIPSAAAGV